LLAMQASISVFSRNGRWIGQTDGSYKVRISSSLVGRQQSSWYLDIVAKLSDRSTSSDFATSVQARGAKSHRTKGSTGANISVMLVQEALNTVHGRRCVRTGKLVCRTTYLK